MRDRISIEELEGIADCIEAKSYTKQYDPQEIQELESKLSANTILLSDIETEKKEFMETIKFRQKPLQKENEILIEDIKFGSKEVTEDCYKVIDRDTKMALYYNQKGKLVQSRVAKKEEMQTTIFELNKNTGNGDY